MRYHLFGSFVLHPGENETVIYSMDLLFKINAHNHNNCYTWEIVIST